MKNGRLQAKDITDVDFLGQVHAVQKRESRWCHVWDLAFAVLDGVDVDGWNKLVRAKSARLIGRGLLTGCACGCRGDFELTEKGARYLAAIN